MTTNDNTVWNSALKSIFNLQPKNFHFNSLMNSTMSLIFLSKLGIFKCFYILRISMSFCWWNFMNSFIQFHNWSVEWCTHNSNSVLCRLSMLIRNKNMNSLQLNLKWNIEFFHKSLMKLHHFEKPDRFEYLLQHSHLISIPTWKVAKKPHYSTLCSAIRVWNSSEFYLVNPIKIWR